MTIADQIEDEKLQYDINKEAVKISALSSAKIDKYEYLTGEERLPSNQKQIIEQAEFSPLGKAFVKQTKTIEDQGKKLVNILKILKPKELETIEDKPDDNEKHLKYKEVFNELSGEGMGKIYNIRKKINFIYFRAPMHIYNEIKMVIY